MGASSAFPAAAPGANVDITSLKGTATNDSAAAGKIGEYIESDLLVGSAVSLTSAAAKTVTSINLTAGDWMAAGAIVFKPNAATTISRITASLSDTTDALNYTVPAKGAETSLIATFTTGSNQILSMAPRRISLSGSATIYLIAYALFAVNVMDAYGCVHAWRMR